jgi:vitamin B12 transporter
MRLFHFGKGVLFFLLLSCSNSFALTRDSIIGMDEVTVVGERFRYFNTGHFYTTLDTLAVRIQPSVNLSELISQQSLLQVNTYGAGSSSISARGTGEKRTPVIWNGFNIQSIISAGTDVAQIPGFFFEDMKVQMGGSSALFGSGAAGGMLYLNNKMLVDQKVHAEINSSLGSFENSSSGAKISFGNSFYSGSLKAFYQYADNDYPYKATYVASGKSTFIDTTQTNAAAKTYGFMFNNLFRINAQQFVKLNFWYNDNDKNIAPTLSDVAKKKTTDADQHDKFAATTAEWAYRRNQMSVWFRSGFFNSKLDYQQPSANTYSNSKATWSVNELEASCTLNTYLKLNVGLNETMEFGKASAFDGTKERYRSAFFTSLLFDIPQIQFKYSISGRGELINGKSIPVTYSTGIEKQIFNSLTLKGNLAKNYRVSSFNDMYYVSAHQYGNPDLKPETGMNYEAGVAYDKTIGTFAVSLGVNGFYSDMKNWMNWIQLTNGDYTVQNIDKARLKGIESFATAVITAGNLKIRLNGMYTRTDARDKNTDKFLANVPKNKTVANVTFKYLNSSLMYQQTWVGKRYSNTANSQEVAEYTIGNLVFSQSVSIKTCAAGIDFGLYNMWNKNYMIIQNYPMPGRNFRVGVRFML